jgi:uncharacterized alkaline shock family protein YloU
MSIGSSEAGGTSTGTGTGSGGQTRRGGGGEVERTISSPLMTEKGQTKISDAVVRKIAGTATREISGVHALGTSGTRAFGAIRQRIPGSSGPNVSQGVAVEVGQQETAIDLDVVIEYGVSIVDLANAIRGNVASAIERMTGLDVVEVNINIDDVFIQGEDDEQPSRVQ